MIVHDDKLTPPSGIYSYFFFEQPPNIAKDTPVWVRDGVHRQWVRGYATGEFDDDGDIICYACGMTSFTAEEEDVTSWVQYALTDPTK